MGSDKATPSSAQPSGRRSRVRTGCLTCRSRKVKCDEARPFCFNCTRLNKACLYQSPLLSDFCAAAPRPAAHGQSLGSGGWGVGGNQATSAISFGDGVGEQLSRNQDLLPETPWFNPDLDIEPASFDFITGEWGDLYPASSEQFHVPATTQDGTPGSSAVPPDGLSPVQASSLSYFLFHVGPPFITPWDTSNWDIVKGYIIQLATSTPAVKAAALAVEELYRNLEDGDNTATALSRYFAAKSAHLSLLKSEASEMETILIVTLLLCCFEVVAQHEIVSSTLKQKDLFVTRLEQRPKDELFSPVSSRIICWLQLFHTKALHLGGRGVLSPKLLELLPEQQRTLSTIYPATSDFTH